MTTATIFWCHILGMSLCRMVRKSLEGQQSKIQDENAAKNKSIITSIVSENKENEKGASKQVISTASNSVHPESGTFVAVNSKSNDEV